MQRILLLMATRTYRAKPFMTAAHHLGGEVIVGTEREQALAGLAPGSSLEIDLRNPEQSARTIADFAAQEPLRAVVGVDDDTTLIAALAGRALGLPGNSPESVAAAQNKF